MAQRGSYGPSRSEKTFLNPWQPPSSSYCTAGLHCHDVVPIKTASCYCVSVFCCPSRANYHVGQLCSLNDRPFEHSIEDSLRQDQTLDIKGDTYKELSSDLGQLGPALRASNQSCATTSQWRRCFRSVFMFFALLMVLLFRWLKSTVV